MCNNRIKKGKRLVPLPPLRGWRLVEIEAIQLGSVLKEDLMSDVLRYTREVVLNDLEGVGPCRIGMREVRSAHVVVCTKEIERSGSYFVIHVGVGGDHTQCCHCSALLRKLKCVHQTSPRPDGCTSQSFLYTYKSVFWTVAFIRLCPAVVKRKGSARTGTR